MNAENVIDAAMVCPDHALCQGPPVPGDGDGFACFMFIGEAPGAREVAEGRAFVGRAGQFLLNTLWDLVGLRREDVYLTNVVKHRPLKRVGTKLKDRPPCAFEIEAYRGSLVREIEQIGPKLIVPLGNVAMRRFLGASHNITDARKQQDAWNGVRIWSTYHPSYVRRQGRGSQTLRECQEDFKRIREAEDSICGGIADVTARRLRLLTYSSKAGEREYLKWLYGLDLPHPDAASRTIGRMIFWSNDLLLELLGSGFEDLVHAAEFLWSVSDENKELL